MIVVKLMGGMGNQLFQYAFGRSMEARGREVYFDRDPVDHDPKRNYCLNKFGLNIQFSRPIGHTFREKNTYFDPGVFSLDNCTFDGYWQSEKYFECVAPFLRKELTKAHIFSIEENSAFVHVRRGDNVYDSKSVAFHGCPDLNYYMSGIGYLENTVHPNRYYIYSDDIDWCKEHFNDPKITIVQGSDYWDLQGMAACKYGIVSNSSFSWWGAWLGQAEIAIAPKKWYVSYDEGDTVPKRWVRL